MEHKIYFLQLTQIIIKVKNNYNEKKEKMFQRQEVTRHLLRRCRVNIFSQIAGFQSSASTKCPTYILLNTDAISRTGFAQFKVSKK